MPPRKEIRVPIHVETVVRFADTRIQGRRDPQTGLIARDANRVLEEELQERIDKESALNALFRDSATSPLPNKIVEGRQHHTPNHVFIAHTKIEYNGSKRRR
jgi:hypothetical protein